MASVSFLGARIACFVETLQLRQNADLRLLVLLSCWDVFHKEAGLAWIYR
jgi:hypothetical protein